jgi:hypothetical protein
MSFVYTKDDIMSTAGMFYALAAYTAVRGWCLGCRSMRMVTRGLLVVVLLVATTGWSVRSLGIHHTTRSSAFKTRNDWALQPGRWKARRWATALSSACSGSCEPTR